MPPPPIIFSSGFILLQLEAATLISNYFLVTSNTSDHNDNDRERNRDENRKKRRLVRYDRERAFNSVMSDYLVNESRFDDKQFERHFRVTKSIFEYIFQYLAANDPYWRNGKDCTKRPKIKPEVKLLAALKVISYGVLFGTFCDFFQMGKSTVRQAVSKLARGVLEYEELTLKFLRQLSKKMQKKIGNT